MVDQSSQASPPSAIAAESTLPLCCPRPVVVAALQLLAPEFIPTGEWQEVQEWQGVPPGLHVKVDLETGRKMARREEPRSADR